MKKYKKQAAVKHTLTVKEEFTAYVMKQLDSKDRISFGGKLKKCSAIWTDSRCLWERTGTYC
ncbi:MAG TPA: hypothetical protein P5511_00940 [Candidatus Goldiibacteriota bacterium]|nr:hypothetical protein [Candidatus Goldiibacteriota bacterium]